jgi:hypothetical protein
MADGSRDREPARKKQEAPGPEAQELRHVPMGARAYMSRRRLEAGRIADHLPPSPPNVSTPGAPATGLVSGAARETAA